MELELLIAAKANEKQKKEGKELGGTLGQMSDEEVIDTKKELPRSSGSAMTG